MDVSREILSNLTIYTKYSRYLDKDKRRESWEELVNRNRKMHLKTFPKLTNEINRVYDNYVLSKKVLPSMRSLQFGGTPIELNHSRVYNCAYFPAKDIKFFPELMFLLLGGTGVGYSVQKHHVIQIPPISVPKKYRKFVIEDSISGWADSVKILLKSFTSGISRPKFDYSQIRPKGARLVTAGGSAPGPAPLKVCLTKLENILENADGRKLTTIEVHEIACHIADAVLSGGIRRAAMIAFFSLDDYDMLTCKSSNWWELHPEFARCNNSVVLERGKVTYEDFKILWNRVKESGAGEPGFMWTNDKEILGNPCFSGDEKLLTYQGYKTFEELSDIGEIEIINKDGNVCKSKVWKTGEKETIKFTNSLGEKTVCTPDHIWMTTENKEIPACDLKGKRLMPYLFDNSNYIDLYVKLGFIQGDGGLGRLSSITHKGFEINIGKNDSDVLNLFGYKNKEGCYSYYTREFYEVCKDLGFDNKSLPERTLPSKFNNFSNLQKLSFLRGLFSANGSTVKGHRVSFKSSCKKLILELQAILSEYNISTYYTTNKDREQKFVNDMYKMKESYDLNLASYRDLVWFYENIGFVQKYKMDSLYNTILEKSPLIRKVENNGSENVYDFSEPTTHWGVVNGYIAHNCNEISLRPYCFCNLTEINASSIESQEDFNDRCSAAAFLGTIQAFYTDFYYLRNEWKNVAEEESLLGISKTGIASNKLNNIDLAEGVGFAIKTNKEISEIIGINPAKRLTTIKPAGTTSLVLGTSSGIHAYHAPFYLRRMRIGKDEAIYSYLKEVLDELIEDEYFKPHEQAVVTIPQKAPEGAIFRKESPLDLLERSKYFYQNWVLPGHISGENTHNISITVSIKDHEWDIVGEWMWSNKNYYNGISVLPYDGGNYKQAPFEECTEETYNRLYNKLKKINLTQIKETTDNTDLTGELACGGGSCEIF